MISSDRLKALREIQSRANKVDIPTSDSWFKHDQAFNPKTTGELLDEIASLRSENERLGRRYASAVGALQKLVGAARDCLINDREERDECVESMREDVSFVDTLLELHTTRPAPAPSEAGQGKEGV